MGKKRVRLLAACSVALLLAAGASLVLAAWDAAPPSSARARTAQALQSDLQPIGAAPGDPIYLRIFKHESQLEVWIQPGRRGDYTLFRTYPICAWSGRLGPKQREGDRQAPEGFYEVGPRQLNPHSQYHLSFNLGYPNAFERAQGWTGSALMVHGACVSIGCYAMTDPAIEEIYTLLAAAIASGQVQVPVHAFPFRMSDAQRERLGDPSHEHFWDQLAPAYALFESQRRPPRVRVTASGYAIEANPP